MNAKSPVSRGRNLLLAAPLLVLAACSGSGGGGAAPADPEPPTQPTPPPGNPQPDPDPGPDPVVKKSPVVAVTEPSKDLELSLGAIARITIQSQDEDGPDWDAVDSILETAAAEFDDLYQAGEYPCPAHRVALWRDGVELADWTP